MKIRFMKDTYAPLLLSTKAKIAVLLSALALLAAGIYGATQVRESRRQERTSLA